MLQAPRTAGFGVVWLVGFCFVVGTGQLSHFLKLRGLCSKGKPAGKRRNRAEENQEAAVVREKQLRRGELARPPSLTPFSRDEGAQRLRGGRGRPLAA